MRMTYPRLPGDVDGPRVRVGKFSVPEVFSVVVADSVAFPGRVTLTARATADGVGWERIEIDAAETGHFIVSDDLRSVHLRKLLRIAVSLAATQHWGGTYEDGAPLPSDSPQVGVSAILDRPSRWKLDDAMLTEVAKVWTNAAASPVRGTVTAPTKAVAAQWDVPWGTAARWVRRARDLGYLSEVA